MTIINGNNYDHIDIATSSNGDITRHMIRDTETNSLVNDIAVEYQYNEDCWTYGTIDSSTGELTGANRKYYITKNYLGFSQKIYGVKVSETRSDLSFYVYAYDLSENYIGVWTGTGWSTSSALVTYFDFKEYPNYIFKIVLQKYSSGSLANLISTDKKEVSFLIDKVNDNSNTIQQLYAEKPSIIKTELNKSQWTINTFNFSSLSLPNGFSSLNGRFYYKDDYKWGSISPLTKAGLVYFQADHDLLLALSTTASSGYCRISDQEPVVDANAYWSGTLLTHNVISQSILFPTRNNPVIIKQGQWICFGNSPNASNNPTGTITLYTQNANYITYVDTDFSLLCKRVLQPTLVLGSAIYSSDGSIYTNVKRTRTQAFFAKGIKAIELNSNDYQFYAFQYSYPTTSTTYYINELTSDWTSGILQLPYSISALAIIFRRIDDTEMTAEDIANISNVIYYYSTTDNTLMIDKAPADALAVTKAIKTSHITTKRNNPTYVDQIISKAQSYLNQGFTYGQTTIFDTNSTAKNIDCSTYVGLLLRGRAYNETGYGNSSVSVSTTRTANSNVVWSINPFDYENIIENNTSTKEPVRTASQLAEWMVDMGQIVPIDEHLANILPGDIIFYGRKVTSTGTWMKPNRFMHINHVAIVVSKQQATREDGWDIEQYPYKHIAYEAASIEGAIGTRILELDGDEYGTNVNTLVLVCRPDLGSI